MSSTEEAVLEDKLRKLECHFTWNLEKEDLDLTDLLNRLEQHVDFKLGEKAGLAQTYNCLGFVKYRLGSSKEALSFMQKSVELTKECRDNDCDKWLIVAYGNLAWLQYHMKCYCECESYLEKIRSIAQKVPVSPLGVHHEVLGEKAWAFFKFSRKYYNQAKDCFEKALELDPKNAQWNCGYAFVLNRIETQAPKLLTMKQLRKALEVDPENDEIKALLAVQLAESSEYDEGEELMEEALEGSPDAPNVIRYVGKFLRAYGSVDRSIALLKRALEKSPTSGFIHHQLGLCYKRKINDLHKGCQNTSKPGDEIQRLRSQCIYHLDKATELKCGFIIAMTELAIQYGEDGKLDRAEELFQQTLQIAKEKNESPQHIYLCYAEFQQYRKRSLIDAITNYMECLKIDEDTKDGKKSAKHLKKINDRQSTKSPASGTAKRTFVKKEE